MYVPNPARRAEESAQTIVAAERLTTEILRFLATG